MQKNTQNDDNMFESTDDSLEQKVTPEQSFNEAVIKLTVLMYQIDGKVTLSEQDYFDTVLASLNWRSGVTIEAYVNDAIHQARVAIDGDKAREFLFSLANGLNVDPARSLEVAMDITEVDGNRSDEELELLSLLSNRVLARGVVA
jgi:alpha-D-ribose 1-methylphosphonate 5-triphosphate synthase subunit PhnH